MWLVALVLNPSLRLSGAEFRMESRIAAGDGAVVSHNLTLFTATRVFDLQLTEPGEAALFDFAENRCVLLRPASRTKIVIPFDELLEFVAAAIVRANDGSPPALVRAAARPEFEETCQPDTGRLVLSNPLMEYAVETVVPEVPSASGQYRLFADWAARMNTLSPGLPPAARLELNRELAERGVIPVRVQLQLAPKEGTRTRWISTHQYVWELTDEDRQRMAQLESWDRSFQPVSVNQAAVPPGGR
jgi:hypothetical protein